ncbi:bacteriohemerythrin [Pseudodesulfovibrio sediminis]|uniref:Hemerythrin n=1 Tax=Pseudodesulfovibrio sediminis TaxID=2810563 RepID=A0ABM7P4C0_9BACT|nr:bacteriohemerythrin [Pseudodesulfovibrio sediminis]BCS87696.1 hemerythrin [Pseudodesulfovibrio sediminis]
MPLMNWDETMSVKSTELDAQHQELISLINDSYEAIQRHDEHKLLTLIEKMRAYAKHHFETEEQYMERYGYPDLEKHKRLHAKFNRDVDEFQKNLFKKTNLSQVFIFLSRWLTNHIMEVDKDYAQCLPAEDTEKK